MAVVKVEERMGKIVEMMRKKRILRGKAMRIENDWTREERAIQWR